MGAGIERGVDSCHKPLTCRFLVAACAVNLPRVEKSCHALCLQRRKQLGRLNIVVFHGIGRATDDAICKSRHGAHKSVLHFLRER